jgi:hypothetical protein
MDHASDCEPTAAVDHSADGPRLVIADPCLDGAWLAVDATDAADLDDER